MTNESETAPKGFEKHATTPANTGWCFLETPWSQAWIEMPEVVADQLREQARRVPELVKALETIANAYHETHVIEHTFFDDCPEPECVEARAALVDAEVTE